MGSAHVGSALDRLDALNNSLPTLNDDDDILSRVQRLTMHYLFCPTSSSPLFVSSILVDKAILSQVPRPIRTPAPALNGCYKISETPTMGMGMFATVDIPRYSRILVEHPLIVVPSQILRPIVPDELKYPILLSCCLLCDPQLVNKFFSLANSFPNDGSITWGKFLTTISQHSPPDIRNMAPTQIARTNNTEINVIWKKSGSILHQAVFLNASRINHRYDLPSQKIVLISLPFRCSCSPNASHTFDIESWSITVMADRLIPAGEEITFAYVDVLQTRDPRRKKLRETRGFDCVCKACNLTDPKAISESDQRRTELKNWASTVTPIWRWLSDPSLPDNHLLKPNLNA